MHICATNLFSRSSKINQFGARISHGEGKPISERHRLGLFSELTTRVVLGLRQLREKRSKQLPAALRCNFSMELPDQPLQYPGRSHYVVLHHRLCSFFFLRAKTKYFFKYSIFSHYFTLQGRLSYQKLIHFVMRNVKRRIIPK